MKRFSCLVLLFCFNCYSHAGSLTLQHIPPPPAVKASGYLLMDFDSGRIIIKNNVHERMEPASLTKVMTSYVVASEMKKGKIHADDLVTVSEKAWRMKGSRMFIEVNKQVPIDDLLSGMIIQSGNDATVALAEHTAGSEEEFVKLMNQYAQELGLTDTHFVNSTGMPAKDHFSTPYDMAMLGATLIRHYPKLYEKYGMQKFKYNKIEQRNRNRLLFNDESVDGIKTGHTESAGYCLMASAKRGNMRLISVVMGTESDTARASESQKLLTYGFRFFETHKLYSANEQLTNVKIWKGDTETLPLGITEDLYVTIPRGQYDNLDASMSINATIIAPAQQGDSFGSVNIRLGTKIFASRDLVALASVNTGGIWHNFVDAIKLWLE